MPGPGSHLLYTLGLGLGLRYVSHGQFGVIQCLLYALNSLTGPDIGSVAEFSLRGYNPLWAAHVMSSVHHPVGYVLVLGLPLAFVQWMLASRLSGGTKELLFSQCFALLVAGCLSHFFLDILFEENGHDPFYLWILGTGYWKGSPPLYPDSVVVVGVLCSVLVVGFYFLNRSPPKSPLFYHNHLLTLLLITSIAILYTSWCGLNLYLLPPPLRRPPVGEEADFGIIVFLAIFFFLPYALCISTIKSSKGQTEQESSPLLPVSKKNSL